MSRPQLPRSIRDTKVIAVLRGLAPPRAEDVAAVLTSNGITTVEITMDSPSAEETIRSIAKTGVVVGAGTVRDLQQLTSAVDAGASFIVSPHTDHAVVDAATRANVAMVPGVLTPTEVAAAWSAGAAAVKLFPATAVGPEFVAALAGPYPEIPVIPTGGITASNAGGFIAGGALAVGLGGWLTAQPDLDVIADRAAAIVEVCRNVSGS